MVQAFLIPVLIQSISLLNETFLGRDEVAPVAAYPKVVVPLPVPKPSSVLVLPVDAVDEAAQAMLYASFLWPDLKPPSRHEHR